MVRCHGDEDVQQAQHRHGTTSLLSPDPVAWATQCPGPMVAGGGDSSGQSVHQIVERATWCLDPAAEEGEDPGGQPGAMVAWMAWALGLTAAEGIDQALGRWEEATQWRRDVHVLPHRRRKGKKM